MNSGSAMLAGTLLVAGLASGAQAAIDLTFDYSLDDNGFFDNQHRRDALAAAANTFEPFMDDLSAIQPGPSGRGFDNTWDAEFENPATGSQTSITDPTLTRNEVLVYAGGRDLSGNTLGQGGPGGFNVSGTQSFIDDVRSRDEPNAEREAGDTDFGPWGGGITFDTTNSTGDPVNWNFDVNSGPASGENDFLSVAIHELGHLLGFGTVDSWETDVNSATQDFVGPNAQAEFGEPVPLASGEGHWSEGTDSMVDGALQETAMDPSINVGTRKRFTDLDYAGMQDIGWQVPEPTTLGLLSMGGIGLLGRPRRRRHVPASA